jgi:hypothetical protein
MVAKPIATSVLYYGDVIKTGFGHGIGFDAPYRRLVNSILENVLELRQAIYPEKRLGLPQVRLYLSQRSQNRLVENIPYSVTRWQAGKLLLPNNRFQQIKIRHRGDANNMNFVLRKKSWRIKTKKKNLFNGHRVVNYVLPQTEDMLEDVLISDMARKANLISPAVRLVELFVNDASQGILYEIEHPDEIFLRSRNIMPVNLYKGETDRNLPKGPGSNLFQSPVMWKKLSKNSRYKNNDRTDLGRFLNLIRRAATSSRDYEELRRLASFETWAKFAAFQILAQSWHNNSDHNQRLIIDDQSGTVSPVLWDTGFSNSFQSGYHFTFDSQPLLSLYLRDSRFLLLKFQFLKQFVLEDRLITQALRLVDKVSDPFMISLQRDIGRSAIIAVSTTTEFLLNPFKMPAAHNELKTMLQGIETWLTNELKKEPSSSWEINGNQFTLFIDGKLPVNGLTLLANPNSPLPKQIRLDINRNGVIDQGDLKIPHRINGRAIKIDAAWLANRSFRPKKPTNSGMKDVLESGISIVPTAFQILLDNNISIQTVSGKNALTGKRFTLPHATIRASIPNKLNRPVFIEKSRQSEIWQGVMTINGIQNIFHPVRILAGTKLQMSPGSSLIFRNKLFVDGEKGNPVEVISNGAKPWGTFALIGKKTSGSKIQNIHIEGGSGAHHEGVRYLAMLSLHDTSNIEVQGLFLKNSHIEDDTMHIVYSKNIRISDFKLINALSDGIDIDISDVVISGGSIMNAGNDCLDFMASNVIVKNIVLSGCGDKGISIGEASQSLVANTKISKSNIGIETKDGSKARVVHTDFVDNKIQINAYKKNWRYGAGGTAEIEKSYFKAKVNSFNSDNKSRVIIDDSVILERFKKDKRVKLSKNIDFTNNRKVRRKEYKISLEKKITSKLLIELANRRGAAQEQSK